MLLFPGKKSELILLDRNAAERSRNTIKGCNTVNGDAVFKDIEFQNWHDPNNWNSDLASVAPHLHRIPCRHDFVQFPRETAYKVEVFNKDFKLLDIT